MNHLTPTQRYWRDRPAVYRVYDADERLIYIGASKSVPQRLAQHRRETWWFELIDRVRVELHPSMPAAFAAETVAIQEEQPSFNVKHTGRPDYEYGHWTLDDFRVCKAWQVANGNRGYLPPHDPFLTTYRKARQARSAS